MTIRKLTIMFVIAGLASGLASCAKEESYSSVPPSTSGDGPKVVQGTPQLEKATDSAYDARQDRGNLIDTRLVFFDFNKSDIRTEFRALLNAHAEYLVDNRNLSIILQGHADERGSTEYNLALGQRRSVAVSEALTSLGVFNDQIEAISYGEERPRALGSNESAWAENRRVELVYSDE